MKLGQTLIDEAKKVCTSDAELARRIGVSTALLCLLKQGKRTLQPIHALKLADIAKVDHILALEIAAIDSDPTGQAAEILGNDNAAGDLAVSGISYEMLRSAATNSIANKLTRLHIV